MKPPAHATEAAIVGGGPAGMTAALLLARRGRRVTLLERAPELGGLWSSRMDDDGFFRGDNSCKVFQNTYFTAPHLFRMIGTDWEAHFTQRYDLTNDWLRPFVADLTWRDRRILVGAWLKHRLGRGRYHEISALEFMTERGLSDPCQAWLRATALGGIAGTLRMTMWEFFQRMGTNAIGIIGREQGPLFWNTQPPNGPGGFVPPWRRALEEAGVTIRTGESVASIRRGADGRGAQLTTEAGAELDADAVFLAVPPPALGAILDGSDRSLAAGLGMPSLEEYLARSRYEHVGIAWFFDRPFELPLGGNCVRDGWHPILVPHPQYEPHLRAPARTVVVGSVATDTTFRHQRLGTLASEYTTEELAQILWEDERLIDPTLPEPIDVEVMGNSSATQIVRSGPLPVQVDGADVYIATNLHGQAPYFTASLESAIQAGAIAAQAFDPTVEELPMGRRRPLPWPSGSAPAESHPAPLLPTADAPT